MTFARANALGWADYETLTATQANTIDINISRAVDGYAGGVYAPSSTLEWREGVIIDASYSAAGSRRALDATGKGTGEGGYFTSGVGAAYAVQALADSSSNAGGIFAKSYGTGVAMWADSSSGTNPAVYGLADTTSAAIQGDNQGSGPAVLGDSTSGTGYGVIAQGKSSSPTKASLRVYPQAATPSSLDDGATWIVGKNSYQRIDGVTNIMNSAKAYISLRTDGSGNVDVGSRYNIKEETGTHTGSDNQDGTATEPLVDTSQSWTTNELVGFKVLNLTDGCEGVITANDATTVTCSGGLSGGTDNDWDNGDSYSIVHAKIGAGNNSVTAWLENPMAPFTTTTLTALAAGNSASADLLTVDFPIHATNPMPSFTMYLYLTTTGALRADLNAASRYMQAAIFGELD